MEVNASDRRREPRFPIQAGATVLVKGNGGKSQATTVDISGCGVLLRFEGGARIAVGDQVVCEFRLAQGAGPALPYWGVGQIVRLLEADLAAVDLIAGGFSPIEHSPHC